MVGLNLLRNWLLLCICMRRRTRTSLGNLKAGRTKPPQRYANRLRLIGAPSPLDEIKPSSMSAARVVMRRERLVVAVE